MGWYPSSDKVFEVGTVVVVETVVVDAEVNKVVELSLGQLSIRKEWLVVDTSPNRMGVSATEASGTARSWILRS